MNKLKKINPIIYVVGLFFLTYIVGIICQLFAKPTNRWGGKEPLSFNPVVCFVKALSPEGIAFFGIVLAIIVVSILWFLVYKVDSSNEDERNFKISKKGTYGTAGWMSNKELKKVLEITSIRKTKGKILGKLPNGDLICLPTTSRLNKHTAVFGASGTGKSRCFVRPEIIQCVARGESVVITDPKGEMIYSCSAFLRAKGYTVKYFNLAPKTAAYSDAWACLNEITVDSSMVELMAQTFADVIIKNTSEGKGDHFWDNSEMNLLKAVCLLVATDENLTPEERNIGTVYDYICSQKNKNFDLSKKFKLLEQTQPDHPALQPWQIFCQAGDGIRGNIIIGLASRLQVFQSKIIREITSHDEIDLELPGKEKCAYFVVMSDQESTLNFLSSLFFSFLFIRLVSFADSQPDQRCPVPVNFILDEFPNIGQIPDFTKKLSTIRSRALNVAVVFQNIAQLENRYPDGLWEEIIGNCDTQFFLGCTDQKTAEFVSQRSGEMTISVTAEQLIKNSIAVAQRVPQYKENLSEGKRFVLNPDEVMRKPENEVFIILRGQKILKLYKFDYSEHFVDLDNGFGHESMTDNIPEWRKNSEKSIFKYDTFDNSESVVINNISENKSIPSSNDNEDEDEFDVAFSGKNRTERIRRKHNINASETIEDKNVNNNISLNIQKKNINTDLNKKVYDNVVKNNIKPSISIIEKEKEDDLDYDSLIEDDSNEYISFVKNKNNKNQIEETTVNSSKYNNTNNLFTKSDIENF